MLSHEKAPALLRPLCEIFRLGFFHQRYEDKITSLPGRVGAS